MLTKRIIPCFDVDNGRVVKGISFVELRDAGDPVELAKLYDAAGRRRTRVSRHHRVVRRPDDRSTTWSRAWPTRCSSPSRSAAACAATGRADAARDGRRQGVAEQRGASPIPHLVARARSASGRSASSSPSTRGRSAKGSGRYTRTAAATARRASTRSSGRSGGRARRRRAAAHEHGHRRPPGRLRLCRSRARSATRSKCR